MILAILNSKNKKLIYIYCNSDIKIDQTFQNIKKRFQIFGQMIFGLICYHK